MIPLWMGTLYAKALFGEIARSKTILGIRCPPLIITQKFDAHPVRVDGVQDAETQRIPECASGSPETLRRRTDSRPQESAISL